EFQAGPGGRAAAFEDFRQRNGWWLEDYALFRAVKERRRWTSWETWPVKLRGRDPDTLADSAASLESRMRFLQYVQWVAAEQWDRVRRHAHARGVLLKGDLPFVCSRESVDVWTHQELFDPTRTAGAPPDAFNPNGQA